MAEKLYFTKAELDDIGKRYLHGESILSISQDYEVSHNTINNRLIENGFRKRGRTLKYCGKCGKKFYTKAGDQKYCHDPCISPNHEKRREMFYTISHIRNSFARLVKNNPYVAKRIRDEMLKEEGKPFTKMALDGIFESNVNNKETIAKMPILSKYANVIKQSIDQEKAEYKCPKCYKRYSRESKFKEHVEKCIGDDNIKLKDMKKVYYYKDIKRALDILYGPQKLDGKSFKENWVKLPMKFDHLSFDDIFMDLNCEVDNPMGTTEMQKWILNNGLNHTSMSPGDIIECNGNYFICEDLGWKKVLT